MIVVGHLVTMVVLTEKKLKIIFASSKDEMKDSTFFEKNLQFSDTLQQIANIDLENLQNNYTNPCVDDGSQITLSIKKDGETKGVHLSNYYQDDIGKIIYLVNSIVPEKYRIWYDKKMLLNQYKECNMIKQ